MPTFSIIGKNLPRVDGRPKVTGEAIYTEDIVLPRMIHAKILRSPYPHAKIVSIDTSEAERNAGVRAVLTHKNVPKHMTYVGHLHPPFTPLDRRIINDTVRYYGEEVAAVAADTLEIAEEALSKIRVEYKQLPTVYDPEEAVKPGAIRLHSEGKYIFDMNHNISLQMKLAFGDIEKAFRESAATVGPVKFKTTAQHTAAMERWCALANWERAADRVTIWCPSQSSYRFRTAIAHQLGIPESKVRIISPFAGGAFGGKLSAYMYHPIAALLSKMSGRPVRVVLTREECFAGGTSNRHPATLNLKLGISKDGLLTGLQGRIYFNTGGYAYMSGPVAYCCDTLSMLYRFSAYDLLGYAVYTNIPPAGAFRGWGNPQGQWALEQLIDMASEEIKMDPFEVRKKNHVDVGDIIKWSGAEVRVCGLNECMEKGSEVIGWKKRTDPDYHGSGTKRRGIGMAMLTHSSGSKYGPGESEVAAVIMEISEDGKVSLKSAAQEEGQGAQMIARMIAAETLGLGVDDIIMRPEVDTDIAPYGLGNYSSRYTYVDGAQIYYAANDLKRQILEFASKKFDAKTEDLEIRQGEVFVKSNPERKATVAEIVHYARFYNPEEAVAFIGMATGVPPTNPGPFGAQFAEVEVDVETGEVKVLRLVAAHDVGRAIHPSLVEGQIHGGLSQGLGYAMIEGVVTDTETGKVLNSDFMDYKILSSVDMPRFHVILSEPIEPSHPYGVKGVGEPAMVATAPAIANAVYNAVGVRITEQPILPEKVLRGLKGTR